MFKRLVICGIAALLLTGCGQSEEEAAKEAAAMKEMDEADTKKRAEDKAKKEAEEKAKLEAEAKKKAEEKKAADEKKAAEKAALEKEQQEIDALIVAMDLVSEEMAASSGGVIAGMTTEYNVNHFKVRVFVDEVTWATSNESEKMSFATTMGTTIASSLAPHETLVDIVSAMNKDVVTSQKVFGGWKIKR
jgi:hypothetical protein